MAKLAYFFSTSMTAHVFFKEHFLLLKNDKNEILIVAGEDSFFNYLKEFCDEKGIKLLSFKARRGYGVNCIPEYFNVLKIAKNLKKQRYRFITNTPKISLYIALFSLFKFKKNIIHYNHGLASYPADEKFKKIILFIEAFICSQSTGVIFVSSSIKNWAIENFPRIFNYPKFYHLNSIRGVKALKRSDKSSDHMITLGYIGRISKAKGFKEFFDIIIRLNSEGFNIGCCIAGNIEDENLRPFVDYLERLWFCEYLGHIENVENFYAKIDILVFPSMREGFGMVALESSASGVPVVAYDIHGVRDAIENNITGKLIAPYNQNKFYEAIKLLCLDMDEINQLGTAAFYNAKNNFDSNVIISQHVKLVQEIFSE
jgi:glycosyltransferase involved in cell wall biosynthesis